MAQFRVLLLAILVGILYDYTLADCNTGVDCKETNSWTNWIKGYVKKWTWPSFIKKGGAVKDTTASWSVWLKDYINDWTKRKTATRAIDEEDAIEDGDPIVKFILYNKDNMDNPEIFQFKKITMDFIKQFDPKKVTKILVHGWKGAMHSPFSKAMVNAYLPAFDYNVILVDWGERAKKFYPVSRNAVPVIGKLLADFIDLLCKTYQIKPEQLHVIGHSLGAHVSGVAGRFIKSGKIGRLSALDPAYPLFREDHNDRLSLKAATFIDTIHTCGHYLGWFNRTGHADFYPNQGIASQPGCGFDFLGKCSHRRAWVYFAESINKSNLFMGVPCNSWDNYLKRKCTTGGVSMGEYLPSDTTGVFYLQTNNAEPFAKGQ